VNRALYEQRLEQHQSGLISMREGRTGVPAKVCRDRCRKYIEINIAASRVFGYADPKAGGTRGGEQRENAENGERTYNKNAPAEVHLAPLGTDEIKRTQKVTVVVLRPSAEIVS
jgi:hypothetical protein